MTEFEEKMLAAMEEIRDGLSNLVTSEDIGALTAELRTARFERRDERDGAPYGHSEMMDFVAEVVTPRFAKFDPADPRGKRAERMRKHDAIVAPFERAVSRAKALAEANPCRSYAADLAKAEAALADQRAKRAEAEKDDDANFAKQAEKYHAEQRERIDVTVAHLKATVQSRLDSGEVDADLLDTADALGLLPVLYVIDADDPFVQGLAAGLKPQPNSDAA